MQHLAGVRDSKALTAARRESLLEIIVEHALAWATGAVPPDEIDRMGIVPATRSAMAQALDALSRPAGYLLIDYLPLPEVPLPQYHLPKGDVWVLSIAAASIVAKVTRDALMRELDRQHPGYGLAHNMGYASEDHRDALRQRGPSCIHRRTFQGTQRWLFA
jgi:ribonuclease HII